jgi:hypothetical protein
MTWASLTALKNVIWRLLHVFRFGGLSGAWHALGASLATAKLCGSKAERPGGCLRKRLLITNPKGGSPSTTLTFSSDVYACRWRGLNAYLETLPAALAIKEWDRQRCDLVLSPSPPLQTHPETVPIANSSPTATPILSLFFGKV